MSERELTCIICPNGCPLVAVFSEDGELISVSGHKCKRGDTYVRSEIVNPERVMTSVVAVRGGVLKMCPVRTNKPVPKNIVKKMALTVARLTVDAPVNEGDVLIPNVLGSKADLVACRTIPRA